MDSETTPENVRRTQFRKVLRGFDRVEVEAFLDGVATRIEDLEAEKQNLVAQLGDALAVAVIADHGKPACQGHGERQADIAEPDDGNAFG